MKIRRALWLTTGTAIGVTAFLVTRKAIQSGGSDVVERIYERGRKIIEDAGGLVERSRRHYESLLR
jgi:hypothetical protein